MVSVSPASTFALMRLAFSQSVTTSPLHRANSSTENRCSVSVPVVGLGGVSSAEDVIEMMLAGATAVEVGAANLVDPFACQRIIADLPGVMDRLGIENLKDIIGGATEWEKM